LVAFTCLHEIGKQLSELRVDLNFSVSVRFCNLATSVEDLTKHDYYYASESGYYRGSNVRIDLLESADNPKQKPDACHPYGHQDGSCYCARAKLPKPACDATRHLHVPSFLRRCRYRGASGSVGDTTGAL
jgi:hypothetical protein